MHETLRSRDELLRLAMQRGFYERAVDLFCHVEPKDSQNIVKILRHEYTEKPARCKGRANRNGLL